MYEALFNQAKQEFHSYLRNYDIQNPKIHLKIVHTYGVVKAAEYLIEKKQLSLEDAYICKCIALLHDIGRFEQLRRYNSFDDSIMPHAQCSLDILFSEGYIKRFIPERKWDGLIYKAIQYHGVYRMPEGLPDPVRFHTALIRDEDKIDNFRVKATDSVTAMVDVEAENLGSEEISEHIFASFLQHKPILNSSRITHMDMWVSYLGYLFDFNFTESLLYLLEHNYINRIIDRIPYTNPKTAHQMESIRKEAFAYIQTKIDSQS